MSCGEQLRERRAINHWDGHWPSLYPFPSQMLVRRANLDLHRCCGSVVVRDVFARQF